MKTLQAIREGQCRFPLWDQPTDPKFYCAESTLPGSDYCARCRAIVYAPASAPVGYSSSYEPMVAFRRVADDQTVELVEALA
jgi:hypothetical protein